VTPVFDLLYLGAMALDVLGMGCPKPNSGFWGVLPIL
jgi:hypothetical protein